jgi:hypothetical protein
VATWDLDDLRGLSLARQFPEVEGRDAAAAAHTVALIGPIQTQTARSTYAALGSRLPGVTHAAVTECFESGAIVRGSSIRGTVHTSTPGQHLLLDATTRVGQRTLWNRQLRLQHADLDDVWAAIEDYARDAWRTPAELSAFLTGWLRHHEEADAAARLESQEGRYFAFGHGGLLRRPLSGPWSGQGAPGYRTASAVVARGPVPDDLLLEVVRLHLASYGPASRYDVAWWSGLGLRQVFALLDRLDPIWAEGPDGRSYADLRGTPPARDLPGVRLVPEFDALLCGYDPKARDRFVTPEEHRLLWLRANGLMLAPVLVDGRLGGYWRIEGTGRDRTLAVSLFRGVRKPRTAETGDAASALASALDVPFSAVTVARA